jgi:hypothetical protein
MKSSIINQINDVPIYPYKKLTIEMIEEALLKVEEQHKTNKEQDWVLSIFGTVEQTTKWMEEFDKAVLDNLDDIK